MANQETGNCYRLRCGNQTSVTGFPGPKRPVSSMDAYQSGHSSKDVPVVSRVNEPSAAFTA